MKIAYVNANYKRNHTGGGHVHMGQFIKNALALGHEIWVYPGNQYPGAKIIPTTRIQHIKTMRQMDVLYIRLESGFPNICTWSTPPKRLIYGFPLVVWEFNTIPDDALMWGIPRNQIDATIQKFKNFGKGCDLAICVAPAAANYVEQNIGIKNIAIIPNGSDPDLFTPEAVPVPRMSPFKNSINLAWIGSAKISYHDFINLRKTARLIWEKSSIVNINFHIIGPDLKFLMADMTPNVFYWGAENYQKLPNWLSAMNIGLYITKGGFSTYGSPLKVFDYMSSSLAVISTDHQAIRDLFITLDQKDLMVPCADAEALARVIRNLASEPGRTKQLGLAGRQLVIDKYNWRRALKDTLDEIEKIFVQRNLKKRS